MTLATTSNTTVAQGNGLTTSFSFSFPVPNDSELFVYLTNPGSSPVLLSKSQYSTTGIGSENGGSVTYPLAGSPIATGTSLTIQRVVPYLQLTSLVDQSGYYPNVVEGALDYLTMQTQQLAEEQQLSISVPLAMSPANLVLPDAIGRANSVVAFDQNGNVETLPISPSIGAGTMTDVVFMSGPGFTPGVTTQLTLPAAYGSASNVWPFFDGIMQFGCTLVGNVLTFPTPIPVGIQEVLVRCGTTLSVTQPSDFYNVGNYGARGNGTTDDTIAIQAAINAASANGGGTVLFPASAYLCGALTLYANVCLQGAGKYATRFIPKASGITMFSLVNGGIATAGVVMRDFQINCGSVINVTGMQFTLCSEVDILNVSFAGCQTNFVIDRGFMHNIMNCESIQTVTNKAGTATIWSSVDSDHVFYTTVHNYKIHSNVYYLSGGGLGCVGPGLYVRRGVGTMINMYANDLNFGGAVNGIMLENDCQGCKIYDSEIGASAAAVVMQQGAGAVAAPLAIQINNSDFDQPESAAIDIINGSWITISGGFITSSGVVTNIPAIATQQCSELTICDTQIIGFNGTNGCAISLTATGNARIQGVRSLNNSVGVAFISGNNNVTVADCSFENTTFPIGGTSPVGASNDIRNNRGANPGTLASQPAVPSSGSAFTNNFAYPCRVYISGGTVTGTAINGFGLGVLTGFVGVVNPGETVTVTYSAAPTWVWVPL